MRFEYAEGRMPVAMEKNDVSYYLTYDQVGSLRVVADSSGYVVKRIDYDSFGNIIDDTNPSFEVPLGFAGGLHDRDTGLVRFGFRDYDPDLGRWTAKDPILFAGGDIDLYGYVLNNPISSVDRYGLIIEADPYLAATTFSIAQLYGAAAALIMTGATVTTFGAGMIATGTPAGVIGGSIVTIAGVTIWVSGAGTVYLVRKIHSEVNKYNNQQGHRQQHDPCDGESSPSISFWGVGADFDY
jgi:RHS repeat-associated protein